MNLFLFDFQFAWLGVICLVSLGIVVVVVLVLIVGALTAAAHVVDSEKASIGVGMPLGVIFIIAAICLAVLIVWVSIINRRYLLMLYFYYLTGDNHQICF